MARRLNLFGAMVCLFMVSIAGVLWSGERLIQAYRYNAAIAGQASQDGSHPRIRFAEAVRLIKAGDISAGSEIYAQIASDEHAARWRRDAYYNLGNVYLREAIKLLDSEGLGAYDRVAPLLSMAKENYRGALRIDAGWIEAKYNLELALLLSPSLQSAVPTSRDEETEDEEKSSHGWPSIPGFPRGMP